jgi:hypothetical protein
MPPATDPVSSIANALGSVFGFANTVATNVGDRKMLYEQLKVSAYMEGAGRYDVQANLLVSEIERIRQDVDALNPPNAYQIAAVSGLALLLGFIASQF